MKKKFIKNILGLTLVEILISLVVSSMMMAAMYTTYSIVNSTYGQVVNKAQISRNSRDLVELLIRDIRMAGFKYYLGTNSLNYPEETYLQIPDTSSIEDSHAPIVIQEGLDHESFVETGTAHETKDTKNNPLDICCDKIHIVFDDFDQTNPLQPYKRYKTTYYARPMNDGTDAQGAPINPRYAIYKSKISWSQPRGNETDSFPATGEWIGQLQGCQECYHEQLIRDYVEDIEFIALDRNGKRLLPFPDPTTAAGRDNLYKIRSVDIKLSFRSEKDFFRLEARDGQLRKVLGFSRTKEDYTDRYLRDSVVVTVYTRNIVDEGLF